MPVGCTGTDTGRHAHADAPEPLLRRSFETTQLSVRLHHDTDEVTITINLPADQLPEIAQ